MELDLIHASDMKILIKREKNNCSAKMGSEKKLFCR